MPVHGCRSGFPTERRCESQEEVDYYWDRLSEGGKEGPCGWLADRYGLSWQVVPSGMMGKLDIATLRAAADGVPAD